MNSPITPDRKAHLLNLLSGKEVRFDYNPAEIGLAHDADAGAMYVRPDKPGASSGAGLSAFLSVGSTRLHFSQLIFVGQGCRDKVDLLCDWVLPNVPLTSAHSVVLGADGVEAKPQMKRPPLRFEWGPAKDGFNIEVELMRFDCSYTRFSATGTPVRAEVRNLTLHLVKHDLSEFSGNGFSPGPPSGPTGGGTARDPMGDPLRSAAPPRLTGGRR
ncbi:hypothetical protein ACFY2H_39115 [Streptomyces griseofuscus]|uniref:hypothetical protein n=1 Tax=Streptomyces griseofuscus TaxID=146922 RepID=UPI0036A674C9